MKHATYFRIRYLIISYYGFCLFGGRYAHDFLPDEQRWWLESVSLRLYAIILSMPACWKYNFKGNHAKRGYFIACTFFRTEAKRLTYSIDFRCLYLHQHKKIHKTLQPEVVCRYSTNISILTFDRILMPLSSLVQSKDILFHWLSTTSFFGCGCSTTGTGFPVVSSTTTPLPHNIPKDWNQTNASYLVSVGASLYQ